jgi:TP901-1 family phage major tail protein
MAKKGHLLLVKRGDGAGPEVFTTLAGLRTKTIAFNAEQVDVTNSDSANRWRELLAAAGVKSCSVSGSGVFKDSAVEALARADFFNQTHNNYEIVIPDFGTVTGSFQLTQLQYAGEHNGEVTWEISLESAAEVTFVAA